MHRAAPRLDRVVELRDGGRDRMQKEPAAEQRMRDAASREDSRRTQRARANGDEFSPDLELANIVPEALAHPDAARAIALHLDAQRRRVCVNASAARNHFGKVTPNRRVLLAVGAAVAAVPAAVAAVDRSVSRLLARMHS